MRDASGPPSGWATLRSWGGGRSGAEGGAPRARRVRRLRAAAPAGARAGPLALAPPPSPLRAATPCRQPPLYPPSTPGSHLDELHDLLGRVLAQVVLLDPGVRVHAEACGRAGASAAGGGRGAAQAPRAGGRAAQRQPWGVRPHPTAWLRAPAWLGRGKVSLEVAGGARRVGTRRGAGRKRVSGSTRPHVAPAGRHQWPRQGQTLKIPVYPRRTPHSAAAALAAPA